MRELREQVRSASAEYHALRYPGDLASDVLRQVHRSRRWMLWGGLASMAAAAAAISIVMLRVNVPADQPVQVASTQQTDAVLTDEVTTLTISFPDRPSRPEAPETFPSLGEVSMPSFPSIPSWSSLIDEQNQGGSSTTTRESA